LPQRGESIKCGFETQGKKSIGVKKKNEVV